MVKANAFLKKWSRGLDIDNWYEITVEEGLSEDGLHPSDTASVKMMLEYYKRFCYYYYY